LETIQKLYGKQIFSLIEHIHGVFSRDDGLRLLITNDDDLNKVIAIADVNQAKKLNFLLTRKKTLNNGPEIKIKLTSDESNSLSDDVQQADFEDTNTESPPPGTIATQKKRTSINGTSKSMSSNNGGLFIPESVSNLMIDLKKFYLRRKMNIHQVEIARLLVENRVAVKVVFDDVYQV